MFRAGIAAILIVVAPTLYAADRPAAPLAAAEERALKPKDSFKECVDCPEMVVVPAGTFIMGSPGKIGLDMGEGPQRKVTIARRFAMGKFEVTITEWDACAAEGGCKYRANDQGWGRGKRPVINVSWVDITQEYLPWLSRKTGRTYRLPTEAEWEYAARAGTTTRYAFGDTITTRQAQFTEDPKAKHSGTVEVGSFQPNKFGLHDMHGNVMEWVQDCWNVLGYAGAPKDGTAWTAGDCAMRPLRGGSWWHQSVNIRSASRGGWRATSRDFVMGFRVFRAMDGREPPLSQAALPVQAVVAPTSAVEPEDCGYPVPRRSIPACSLLIERGGASPERQAELLLLRGSAYIINGDNDQAIKDLDEAIRLKPDDADALFARGGAYYKKGDYGRAIADYDQVSWLKPDHLGAYAGRGDAHRKLGRGQPTDDPAFSTFGRSLFEGSADVEQRNDNYWRRVENTFKLLDEAIRQNPQNADVYFKRANVFRSIGRRQYDRALADYDQAIRRDNKHLNAYAWRAVVHHAKGNYDLAIADLDEVIRARPELDWPLSNRAVVYEQRGDYDRAIADLTEAIRVETSKPPLSFDTRGVSLYARRGLAYERKGDREKAIADYRTIVALWPSKSTSNVILESVKRLQQLGADLSDFPLFDEAQQVARFTQLTREHPKNDNYFRARCGAYLKKREYDNAIADCDEAIVLAMAEPPPSVLASLTHPSSPQLIANGALRIKARESWSGPFATSMRPSV
jgi:formylglycine-generating enzyme required for sulfatase activity/tetratricopeptide (TPR) repeat protein